MGEEHPGRGVVCAESEVGRLAGGQALRRRKVGMSERGWPKANHCRVLLDPVRSWHLPLISKGSLWET